MNQFSSSSSSSSSSPSSYNLTKHDVFLSFRGEDTRDNFTSHLHVALEENKIMTYIDNNLVRGEEISLSLLKAIEESKISIVILSQNYSSSKWCLDELVKIRDSMKNNGQIVIPVFYRVDPSHVRNQTGNFGAVFARHEESLMVTKHKVQSWRDALKYVANLSGWDSMVTRPESKLIKEIIKDVLAKLNRISPSYHSKGLVGIESRIQHIEPLLCLESSSCVRVIGIWGMGGLGKTTLARAIYDQISPQFESCCFLSDTREQLKRCTISQLQDKLFSALLEKESLSAGTLSLRPSFVNDRLCRKKVLIVVDDVDSTTQLQELLLVVGGYDLFGPGSRILLTSRDKQVLKNASNAIYVMEELNQHEALQLFSLHAFKQDFPPSDRILQTERVINYAKGNPLVLRVLGSALLDRHDKDWESMLKRLGNIPNSEVHNVLRISYDGLDSQEQSLFLDIACFFRGQSREYVTKILDRIDYSVHFAITTLIDKSLIMVSSDNVLEMHDLLQEMGRKIVLDESRHPEKRSRLWNPEDVSYVLMENKGSEVIEGISLDMSMAKEIGLEPDVFAKMHHLRFLNFYARHTEEKFHLSRHGIVSLPKNLRYLHWTNFSLKSLPSEFFPENLVVLKLPNSKVKKLWTGIQDLGNLIEIDLSGSQYLTKIPDLSKSTNIETINLKDCRSLVEVHSSIQNLHKLEFLYLEGCENLKDLPARLGSKVLQVINLIDCPKVKRCPEMFQENMQELCLDCAAMIEVPESILLLPKVAELYVANCKKISSLPSTFYKMESLMNLYLVNLSELQGFPEILEPMNIEKMDLSNCRNLKRLPDSIYNLKSLEFLILEGTGIEEVPSTIQHLSCLVSLELRDCKNLQSLPSCIHRLPQLNNLYIGGCKRLTSLPELPPSLQILDANNCVSLQTLSCNFRKCCNLAHLDFANCLRLDQIALGEVAQFIIQQNNYALFYFPGTEVPRWFAHQSVGSSITLQFPLDWDQFKGIAFCVVFEFRKPPKKLYDFRFKIDCVDDDNANKNGEGFGYLSCPSHILVDSCHVLIVYYDSNQFKKHSGNVSSFGFCGLSSYNKNHESSKHCKVKRCGVHLLQDNSSPMGLEEPIYQSEQ